MGAPVFLLVLLASALITSSGEGQEFVSFPTSDGGVVYADQRGTGDHAVVLAHGGQFTKESWEAQAQALTERGFRTLAIDFRGRGQSRGGPGSESDDEYAHLDVLAAIRFLRENGAARVSLIGASFGGWASARAATQLPSGQIDRLVLLAHSPIADPQLMQGRKLFIVARDDRSGGGTLRLPSIQDQFDRTAGPKELVILAGSSHAQHIFATDQGPLLLAEIIRFMTDSG